MARKKKSMECKLFPFERVDCLSLQDAKQKAGWNITAFDLPDAWKHTQGEGIKIAVLDTGCDLDHPDLVGNLLPGMNFSEPGRPPNDRNGHGTHVIGTICAMNNDIGVVGVAPKAKVLPVKVLGDDGNGNLLNVARGIRWAADQGVDFISMSLGAPVKVQQVRKAIQYAATKGAVCFVAAGNAGDTKEVFYPANYPETIAIGAINNRMNRAVFSNTGRNLDFMAPGVDIFSTVPDNWYAALSGTSMAQPFACGVAALLKSYIKNNPKLSKNIKLESAEDYRTRFKKHVVPISSEKYKDKKFYQGFGIIDPRLFVDAIDQFEKENPKEKNPKDIRFLMMPH